MSGVNKNSESYKNMLKALDFCYSDDGTIRFNMIDGINLCVTVIAYATHAFRANQMLTILDVVIPRYLDNIKNETDKISANYKFTGFHMPPDKSHSAHNNEMTQQARSELANIQKIAVSIKTLVNTSDFLARTYSGPKADKTENATNTKNFQNKSSMNRSPSIMPDEDSMRFTEEKPRNKNDISNEDKQIRNEFRSPRDTLLNIISEFVFSNSKRIKELYKIINDSNLKVSELLDTKSHAKLVEIAHALLKLWDDSITLGGNGLQK